MLSHCIRSLTSWAKVNIKMFQRELAFQHNFLESFHVCFHWAISHLSVLVVWHWEDGVHVVGGLEALSILHAVTAEWHLWRVVKLEIHESLRLLDTGQPCAWLSHMPGVWEDLRAAVPLWIAFNTRCCFWTGLISTGYSGSHTKACFW